MKHSIILFFIFLAIVQISVSQVISEWRGPGRTGVYNETGLLTEWKEDGPELIWSIENIPDGYSSVSVAYDIVIFTGIVDSMDVLVAVDFDGNKKWQTPFGRAWKDSYTHSRSTPTIENYRAYVSSGYGDIACADVKTGEIIWSVKASEELKGTFGRWGIAESPLIVDDKVIFTPGGDSTTIIALDKSNGELIWMSECLNDKPSYSSPLLVEWEEKRFIVAVTQTYVIGVNPENGNIIWKFDFGVYARGEWRANNQTNTPLFFDGKIYITSGYDHCSVQIELSEDADQVYFNWVDTTLDVHHGGVVKYGEYIYGANWVNNRMGYWVCLDWETGKVMYEKEWENKGSIILAEGMLYCYEEKNGNIALVKATPDDFTVISSFKVPLGKGPHWSHPVINNGILYIRHEDALMAYSIKNLQ
ncbi:MAG: PQQ-binding-like beta-propeller repeat protein [Bacteroidales bacterium]|nr:PQQ-binding-like beta-propeller repeat protein [Bacteroidales bacterium]